MRLIGGIFLLFVFFAMTVTVYGEFYEYQDESGVLTYTDDYSTLSESQKKEAKAHKTVKPDDALQESDAPDAVSEIELENRLQLEFDSLKKINASLLRESESLEADRKALRALKQDLEKQNASAKQIQEYNDKVTAYNERVNEYDKKVSEFEARQKAYNEALKAAGN